MGANQLTIDFYPNRILNNIPIIVLRCILRGDIKLTEHIANLRIRCQKLLLKVKFMRIRIVASQQLLTDNRVVSNPVYR